MDLFFGLSEYSRERGNIAELPVVNMIAEAQPSEGRVVLQSRPGLALEDTIGTGPINGLFQRDGVLGGAIVAVSGDRLHVAGIDRGAIAGGGFVSFAGDEEELVVNAGSLIYQTDGVTLGAMAFPDGADVTRVFDLAGYNIALRAGTGRFYYRLWGVNVWDGADYVTAENEPDSLIDACAIDDYIVLFGTETTEFWVKTGDFQLPFAPVQGRVFEKGIRGVGCCVPFDNSVAWVSDENLVYIATAVPSRISNSGIEEKLGKSATCRVDTFFWEGHEFLRIRGDDFSKLYDAQTRQWYDFESYGLDNWRALTAIQGPYFGDDATGSIWRFDGFYDALGPLERRFRAGAGLESPMIVDNIRLTVNVGQATLLEGEYSEPVIEMRTSDDAGITWSAWEQSALGVQGAYRTSAEFRRVGMFDDPGMLVEFRCTDPVPFRVSAVQANVNSGGRQR